MTSGVYWIANKVSGKVYVGSAVNVLRRWRTHRAELRGGRHHSEHLQRSWDKHGEPSFLFELLAECAPENLVSVEQQWMDFFGREWLYNVLPTAGSCLGRKHRDETKKKMADAWRTRKPISAESRAKQAAALRKTLASSPEIVARQAESKKRTYAIQKVEGTSRYSAEALTKHREGRKALWAAGVYANRVRTEEHNRKISEGLLRHSRSKAAP